MLKELREKQARIATNARAKFDEIKDNTPAERAAEIEREFDAMMAEHDALGERIARAEKLDKVERALNAPDPRRPGGAEQEARGVDEGDKPDYRTAFRELIRSGGNAADLPVDLRAALRGGVAEFRAQSTSNTAGGYTVPVTLANFIIKSMAMWGPMYDEAICTVVTTASGEQINIPTIDDTAVAVAKHTEATALTDDGGVDVTVGQKVLNAYVYDTEFVRWSMELMQDSNWNWEQLLGELLGERLGRRANTELTTGDGTGDPNGIVTASTAGKTAAAVAATTFDELMDLMHSVDPAYRMSPKCRWMFNDGTFLKLRKLKDGNGSYLWQRGDVSGGVAPTLLDKPYSINQAMPAMTTGLKPIVFGDFSKYYVRKVGAPVIGVMRERFWPDLGIAGLIRLDGELGDTAAVKHMVMA